MKQLFFAFVFLSWLSGCSFLSMKQQPNLDAIKRVKCPALGGRIITVNNRTEAYCLFPNGMVIPVF